MEKLALLLLNFLLILLPKVMKRLSVTFVLACCLNQLFGHLAAQLSPVQLLTGLFNTALSFYFVNRFVFFF